MMSNEIFEPLRTEDVAEAQAMNMGMYSENAGIKSCTAIIDRVTVSEEKLVLEIYLPHWLRRFNVSSKIVIGVDAIEEFKDTHNLKDAMSLLNADVVLTTQLVADNVASFTIKSLQPSSSVLPHFSVGDYVKYFDGEVTVYGVFETIDNGMATIVEVIDENNNKRRSGIPLKDLYVERVAGFASITPYDSESSFPVTTSDLADRDPAILKATVRWAPLSEKNKPANSLDSLMQAIKEESVKAESESKEDLTDSEKET